MCLGSLFLKLEFKSSAIQFLLSLSKVGTSIAKTRVSKTSIGMMSSISSISSIGRGSIGGSSDNSNIVCTAIREGIGNGESIIYLSNGVGISISFSFTLAISVVVKTGITIGNRGSSISNMSNSGISGRCSITNMSSISTVANGSNSLHKTIAIVNTSYNTTVGASSCDLANGVGISITVSIDSGQGQKDKCKGSHLGLAEQSS